MTSDEGMLFIEPSQAASPEPVIDHLTRKMCAAFRKASQGNGAYGGVHMCFCGATSSSSGHFLPGGELTNSLCVHYLAHHRSEVPPQQLARIEELACGEAEPTELELIGPQLTQSRIRASVERRLGPDRLSKWVAWGLDFTALCQEMQCLTKSRRDVWELFEILEVIEAEEFPRVEEAVLRSQDGDIRRWGTEALRTPGWNRELWVPPLIALFGLPGIDKWFRRNIAMCFRFLGPRGAAAAPALLELGKGASGDLAYDVRLALHYIGSTDTPTKSK
jgi:hypothetical protein